MVTMSRFARGISIGEVNKFSKDIQKTAIVLIIKRLV